MAGLEFGGGAGTPLWFNLNLLCLHPYLNIDLSAHCYVPAAKCLVEVVMEMYREGVTVDDVAVSQRQRCNATGGSDLAGREQTAVSPTRL